MEPLYFIAKSIVLHEIKKNAKIKMVQEDHLAIPTTLYS